jgi:hypothetical protein
MTAVESKDTEDLTVKVTLTITHSVWVKVNAESDATMNQLKQAALDEYHRDPNNRGIRRNDDTWRFQFTNRSNIEVGSERVTIASIESKPRGEWE